MGTQAACAACDCIAVCAGCAAWTGAHLKTHTHTHTVSQSTAVHHTTAPSMATFRRGRKTHLFRQPYPNVIF